MAQERRGDGSGHFLSGGMSPGFPLFYSMLRFPLHRSPSAGLELLITPLSFPVHVFWIYTRNRVKEWCGVHSM